MTEPAETPIRPWDHLREHSRRASTLIFWYGVLSFTTIATLFFVAGRAPGRELDRNDLFAVMLASRIAEPLWGRVSLLGPVFGDARLPDDPTFLWWLMGNGVVAPILWYLVLLAIYPPSRRTRPTLEHDA